MTFLPENYTQPSSGGSYLKFAQGATKFRIMSDSIQGRVDWDDKTPVRTIEKPETSFNPDRPAKHFRTFVVYDYADGGIKICEVTQKSIQNAIMQYYKDEDRGDPKGYDLKVVREGEKLETSYTVMASNPTKNEEAEDLYKKTPVNLNALFDGENPFETEDISGDLPR